MSALEQNITWAELVAPVPLRTIFLFYLAPLFIGLNIKGLNSYGISFFNLLDCRSLNYGRLVGLFIRLISCVLIPLLLLHCFLIFNGSGSLEENSSALYWEPSLIFLLASSMTGALLFLPLDMFYKTERMMLLGGLRRVIFDGFQSSVFFSDVLLADILTSYSRVLGDFFNSGYQSFFLNSMPESNAAMWSDVLTPIVVSLPFFFRLRQCVAEFISSECTNNRHILNALKYASSFPVIFLSPIVSKYVLSNPSDENPDTGNNEILFGSTWLYHCWFFFVILNSVYSFLWDILMDWDLGHFFPYQPETSSLSGSSTGSDTESSGLLSPSAQNSYYTKTKLFLRETLHFSDPWLYYLVVVLNLLLRITWTLKISRRLDIYHAPFGDFIIELMELLRRFIWVFLRLEKEHIHRRAAPSSGPTNCPQFINNP